MEQTEVKAPVEPENAPEVKQEPPSPPPPQSTTTQVAVAKPVEVEFDKDGGFVFHNHTELQNAVAWLLKKAKVTEQLQKAGPDAVAAAILWAKQANVPASMLSECGWINGRLTQYGSLVSWLAERHPLFKDKQIFWLDEAQDAITMDNKNLRNPVWAVVVRIRKKGFDYWNEYYFTRDEAEQAGLLTANTRADSTWVKYTKDMLMHKANARALRSEFPGALKGVNYDEDLREVWEPTSTRQLIVGSGRVQSTDDLNNEL